MTREIPRRRTAAVYFANLLPPVRWNLFCQAQAPHNFPAGRSVFPPCGFAMFFFWHGGTTQHDNIFVPALPLLLSGKAPLKPAPQKASPIHSAPLSAQHRRLPCSGAYALQCVTAPPCCRFFLCCSPRYRRFPHFLLFLPFPPFRLLMQAHTPPYARQQSINPALNRLSCPLWQGRPAIVQESPVLPPPNRLPSSKVNEAALRFGEVFPSLLFGQAPFPPAESIPFPASALPLPPHEYRGALGNSHT